MNINTFFTLLLFLIISSSSFAGDRKGNGADFVSCPDRAYLLDFYEGSLTEFSWQGSEIELINFLFNKIMPLSPVRLKEYLALANNFYNETKFVTESELGQIPDAGKIQIPIPENCRLVQGVLQKLVIFGTEKRYLINKNEWERLSVIHRAGVIIHELIYRELQSGDSHQIRKFNNWLFSTGLDAVPLRDFYSHLQSAGFEWVYLYGFPMDVQKLIWNDGPLRSISTVPGKPFKLFNQPVLSKKHIVDSYLNGHPKLIGFVGPLKFANDQYLFEACAGESSVGCKINLNEEGKIMLLNRVDVTEKSSGRRMTNKIIKFKTNGEIDEIL